MAFFVIEEPLSAQLHAEDEEAEQLCQSAAENIEPEVHFKPVSQISEGVLPESTMCMGATDLVIQLPHGAVVERGARQQTEQFYGLDGQENDDAPHPLRRQITDGDEQQTIARIEHQDVAVVEGHIDDAEHEQQTHAPSKAA